MKLYLVPTPIGNLEDITLRALRILREEVDVILAEDTRTSGNLLRHYNISKPMSAFHINNEHKVVTAFAERILAGEKMALVMILSSYQRAIKRLLPPYLPKSKTASHTEPEHYKPYARSARRRVV